MTLKEEFSIKLARVRELLKRQALDAIYIKRQDNFSWLSCGGINYVGIGDLGNCGLLVTRTETHAITNNIEGPRIRDEEDISALGFEMHAGVWHDNGFEARKLAELVPSGKIGYDYACGAGVNVAPLVQALRYALTEAEVERYKEAGKLVTRVFEEALAATQPGETEHDVIGRLVGGIRAAGMDVMNALCAADERIYRYRHPIPYGATIRERVQLSGNFRYRGLVVCCTRLLNFVPVTAELRMQLLANLRVHAAYYAASVPGRPFSSVLEAGRAVYDAHGYAAEFDKHHQGGPMGYTSRDFRIASDSPGVIRENQAFGFNPTITGTKSEETGIATAGGIIQVCRPQLFPSIELEAGGQQFIFPDILVK